MHNSSSIMTLDPTRAIEMRNIFQHETCDNLMQASQILTRLIMDPSLNSKNIAILGHSHGNFNECRPKKGTENAINGHGWCEILNTSKVTAREELLTEGSQGSF